MLLYILWSQLAKLMGEPCSKRVGELPEEHMRVQTPKQEPGMSRVSSAKHFGVKPQHHSYTVTCQQTGDATSELEPTCSQEEIPLVGKQVIRMVSRKYRYLRLNSVRNDPSIPNPAYLLRH